MINGFAAECILLKLIKGCSKFKPFKLPSSERLIAMAQSRRIGGRRLKQALPDLASEYGVSLNQGDWERVPPTVILENAYSLLSYPTTLGHATETKEKKDNE